jgi:ribosomal protein S18 acetylase RimI-like enzyme
VQFVPYARDHLAGVLQLCEAEGWPSLPADPERAARALAAPGVVTIVAVDGGDVVGFAQLLTDGEIQAYLCNLAVASSLRRRGIGRRLVEEAFARSGAQRIDLLAVDESADFYRRRFDHRALPGFRIYPPGAR